MSAEENLYTALSSDGGVTALVGNKIFADKISQDTERPCIVYQRDSTEPTNTIMSTTVGEFINFTIVIHSDGRANADAIAAAIKTPLYAADFWQTDQSAGFEPELDANSVAVSYRYFISN